MSELLEKIKSASSIKGVISLLRGDNPVQRINFNDGYFTSQGVMYFVQPLEICYQRLYRFKKTQKEVLSGVKVEEAINLIATIYLDRTQGRKQFATIEASYNDIMARFRDFYDSIQGKHPNEVIQVNMESVMMFCTLFVTRRGADLTVYDETQALEDVENWKKDTNYEDFFFLAQQRSILYSENLTRTIQKAQSVKAK